MAHFRRKLETLQNDYPEARHLMDYIRVLYMIEANLKAENVDAEAIKAERQGKSVPMLRLIKALMRNYCEDKTPKYPLRQACEYGLVRWNGLCAYCLDGHYEIDNSAVDRVFKSFATGRLCCAQHNLPVARLLNTRSTSLSQSLDSDMEFVLKSLTRNSV